MYVLDGLWGNYYYLFSPLYYSSLNLIFWYDYKDGPCYRNKDGFSNFVKESSILL